MPEEVATLCPGCQRLQAQVDALTLELQQLHAAVTQLQEQLTAATLALASVAHLPADYDMRDADADKKRWPHLTEALELCEETIRPVFDQADQRAMVHQRWHKYAATAAALCGTAAVICAIVHLADVVPSRWSETVEIFSVGIALLAVILGLKLRFHKKWLIQRNKAERCRFLKFRFLIQYVLASGDANAKQACKQELSNAVSELHDVNTEEQLEHWARTDPLMELLSMHEHGPKAEATLPDLTDYYLEKRIRCQLAFLEPRILRNKWQDRVTVRWPFWLFFLSVFFAMLHFAWNLLSTFTAVVEREGPTARWIIFLAASLPVLSAGVATWRAAHQFARNMKRYQHCHHALTQLRNHLRKPTPAVIRFRDFLACESKLEAEHRNWLHLMTEAEWF